MNNGIVINDNMPEDLKKALGYLGSRGIGLTQSIDDDSEEEEILGDDSEYGSFSEDATGYEAMDGDIDVTFDINDIEEDEESTENFDDIFGGL